MGEKKVVALKIKYICTERHKFILTDKINAFSGEFLRKICFESNALCITFVADDLYIKSRTFYCCYRGWAKGM